MPCVVCVLLCFYVLLFDHFVGDDAPDAPPVISEQKKNSFNVPSVPTTTDTATAMLSKVSY